MLQTRVMCDVLDFLATVGMIEEKNSWQEIAASGGGPGLGG